MDFMKVFDQTVREIKREVNLKVLKVPEIEQKVLDATDNEPWGPHGSALSEIAHATKKFSECQMVMNVLWTRLTETGKDWRYVYKALTVIEYLVGNGSERAVDDIIEHTFQISSLSSFEYVEPSGKDMGINVRKKAETIVALLHNKDKIQEVRSKASANREKYVGLSSTGITYKSGATSFSGSGSRSSDGFRSGKNDGDKFSDSYKDTDSLGEEVNKDDDFGNFKKRFTSNDEGKFCTHGVSKDQNDISITPGSKLNDSADFSEISSKSSNVVLDNFNDDFDDFDPRGTSTSKAAAASTTQVVDLFGPGMVDLLDLPVNVPAENTSLNGNLSDVDLFADAAFVSAPPHAEEKPSFKPKIEDDPFASQAAVPPSVTSTVNLLSNPGPAIHPENNITSSPQSNAGIEDPFAAVPLNNFDRQEFTSYTGTILSEPSQHCVGGKSVSELNPPSKESFQVKSGIWADSLSRGLIDLNISAPKKLSLVDVGIVGGLSDGSDEKEKGPQTIYYMGRAMGAGSGLGRTGVSSSSAGGGYDMFSQKYQFGDFQK